MITFQHIKPMWVCCECHVTEHAPDYEVEDSYLPPGWKKVWRGFRGWDYVCPNCPPYPRRSSEPRAALA